MVGIIRYFTKGSNTLEVVAKVANGCIFFCAQALFPHPHKAHIPKFSSLDMMTDVKKTNISLSAETLLKNNDKIYPIQTVTEL